MLPVDSPALVAGPFSLTCLTKIVSIGIKGSSNPADIPRCHSSGQSCKFKKANQMKNDAILVMPPSNSSLHYDI